MKSLKAGFVPVAANVRDLQGPDTEVARWFLASARQVNYKIDQGEPAEGFYVLATDGTPLAFTDWQDALKVLEVLDKGAVASRGHKDAPWEARPVKTEHLVPAGGTSVVRTFTRVRPIPEGANPIIFFIVRENMLIYSDEVKALLAAKPGDHPLPSTLTARLARFHLIDNVRGEPDMWRENEVRRAVFTVHRVGGGGAVQRFAFEGTFAQLNESGDRGLEGSLHGEFEVNAASGKVVRFRAYGEAQAWGSSIESKCTLLAPKGKYPLVFAMVEARDLVSQWVPPQGAVLGGVYRSPRIGN